MSASGKRLSTLLADLVPVAAERDCTVRALALDSRVVTAGTLFLALPGARYDGRAFINDALARGAHAVVYDPIDFDSSALAIPAFAVADLWRHVSAIADRFYGSPSRRLAVIGVTGTNGKTTCTQLLAQALDTRDPRESALGAGSLMRPERSGRCGVVGTLGYGFPGALDPGLHTTPDAITMQRLLAEFAAAGATHTAMEVSSHALAQGRVEAVSFTAAVFTNLSRDHLDYHGDMESYAAAKARLFFWDGLKAAVINCEDEYGRALIEKVAPQTRVLTYGIAAGDVHALALECARDGLRLRAATPGGEVEIAAPLLGRFNAANLLAALATLIALGFEAPDAARRLSGVQPVPGRTERFKGSTDQPLVVVDYAHTPDALAQVLTALRPHASGRLWCVFGCGGDRDRGKRPQMGAIAERLADLVIVTDDNPRREAGDAIVRDIVAGMHKPPRVIRERPRAIRAAVTEAAADDVVLIAGKGHEDYQQIGDVRHPYSDRDTVRTLLGIAA